MVDRDLVFAIVGKVSNVETWISFAIIPIVEKFGGELVIANVADCLEGTSPYAHMVVYKFKSKALAKSFYESSESRELSKFRNEVTEGFAVLMPEYEMPK